VLADGKVVARIFKVPIAPQARPWMWGERPQRSHTPRRARLRADARGGNGGVRQKLAAGVVLRSGNPLSRANGKNIRSF